MRSPARRRFLFFCVPALVVLAVPLLACGVGNAQAIPECEAAPNGDACRACCSDNGFNGNLYNGFGEPACQCM